MAKTFKDFILDENLSLGDVGGMGAVSVPAPNSAEVGSGDVPAGRKKKKKKKKLKSLKEFAENVNEAPMDKRFQKEWEKSCKVLVTHIDHELKKKDRENYRALSKLRNYVMDASSVPEQLANISGLNEGKLNEGNWKDKVEEIEISIDGLSVGEFAKAVVAALKTSYGDELSTRNKFLRVLNSII